MKNNKKDGKVNDTVSHKVTQKKQVDEPHGKSKARIVPKQEVEQALLDQSGNIVEVAKVLGFGMDRRAIYRLIDQYDLRDTLEEARTIIVDIAESALKRRVYKEASSDSGTAEHSMFVLRTLGKRRGYGDSLNIAPDDTETTEDEVERMVAEMEEAEANRASQ